MDYRTIGRNIQKRRNALGITQEELAEAVGISTSYMGAVEQGKKLPKLKIFIEIANALHISSDTLLLGVLKIQNEIIASDLSKEMSQLPEQERNRILHVLEAMIH